MVNVIDIFGIFVYLVSMKERPKKWTHEQIVNAVRSSSSIRQVLQKIGLIPAGGNDKHIQRKASRATAVAPNDPDKKFIL